MNRRSFLRLGIGGAAAAVAVRTFPFRVYSLPSVRRFDLLDMRQWDGVDSGTVWYLNPDQAKAFEALELEQVREQLPTLVDNSQRMMRLLKQSKWPTSPSEQTVLRVPIGYVRRMFPFAGEPAVAIPSPIASPLENFKLDLPFRRFRWRQLLKGA
jgi:hypothetical protein